MIDNTIIILGEKIRLYPMDRSSLPILYADEQLFFADIEKIPVCIFKVNNLKWTPKQFSIAAKMIARNCVRPVVYYFNNIDRKLAYRLRERAINFIVGNSTAYLPELMMSYKEKSVEVKDKIVPSGQVIFFNYLLAHINSLSTYNEIVRQLSMNYLNVSRGIKALENCNLCSALKKGKGVIVEFSGDRASLWEDAQPYLSNPIVKSFYCDKVEEAKFLTGGISALSEYSDINPDNIITLSIGKDTYKSLTDKKVINNENPYGGETRIEIWKYNPELISRTSVVDPFSLFLTLKDDADPRIQKELNNMIDNVW